MANHLEALDPTSRVWIYGAERAMTPEEVKIARNELQEYVKSWAAHQRQLVAGADILHDRFLVLAVDESAAEASGCSIDGSVRFIQDLGARLGIDFFNRMRFSYRDANGAIQTVSREEFKDLYQRGQLENETIVFDPLVKELGRTAANL
jgi:hypothetical protein